MTHPISFEKFNKRLVEKKLVDPDTGEIKAGKKKDVDKEWNDFLNEQENFRYKSED